ncbi:hypothetical protein OSTOST_14531, partial [Ostertagia ostertagi]
MYCLNSLLSLRLLLIAVTVVFLRKVYDEVQRELSFDLNDVLSPPAIEWRAVDVETPVLINNSLYAKLRLNEFLAVPQYRCNETLHFGDTSESFTACGENGPIEQVLVVTGNTLSSGKFERDLAAKRGREVHYLTELDQWDRWATWDIEYAIRGRTYDMAKLELYAFQFQAHDQPSVNMTARHLALTINVDSGSDSETTNVLGEWYRLFYWLFYSQGYALIGATSSGVCGQESQNCKYRVSLMRVDSAESRLRLTAPVFGLGSPKEELARLVNYLSAADCSYSFSGSFPSFCTRKFGDESKVALITSPYMNELVHASTFTAYGIGPPNRNETVDGKWKLDTLGAIMTRIFGEAVIDLLLIDMSGGEVAIYPELLRLASKGKINQLAIRGHLWSEENENYRMIYWNLRQMQNYGYSRRIGRVDLPRYDVVFERKIKSIRITISPAMYLCWNGSKVAVKKFYENQKDLVEAWKEDEKHLHSANSDNQLAMAESEKRAK